MLVTSRSLYLVCGPPSHLSGHESSGPPVRVVHIITGLKFGGAERMLVRLVERMPSRYDTHVVCMGPLGPLEDDLRACGATVYSLGMRKKVGALPGALWRLTRLLREIRPDVVQTWMYHADLFGGIAARLAGISAIAWNIRTSNPYSVTKWSTRLVARVCAFVSGALPKAVIFCGRTALDQHVRFGYRERLACVVENGFDLGRFYPDPSARSEVRREFDIPEGAPLVGYIARFDPVKNHQLFFEAARKLHGRMTGVYFLLAGEGIDDSNADIRSFAVAANVEKCTRLLGVRADVPRLTAALDVATLCSTVEGFPNVVGEALACGVPCVSTDVGEAALIVGNAGSIVPSGDSEALALEWQRILDLSREARVRIGMQGRKRVAERFSLESTVSRYSLLYDQLLESGQSTDEEVTRRRS